MKLSVAIAGENALPSAFVVFRGFEKSIQKAAELGFHGVELALRRAEEIAPSYLKRLLDTHGLEVSCISTGQVYADGGLRLTHENAEKRANTIRIFKALIDLAAEFGQIVNIGRVRGSIGDKPRKEVEDLFIDVARELCAYALKRDVTLILEPVNRYEIDFIVSVREGVELMEKIGMPNMMLMPDVFHMNIEDVTIGPELAKHIDHIKYIHIADSNRLAPGQGHLDFRNILDNLLQVGYDGWLSLEILPNPDPDTAARQAADFVLPLIKEYNSALSERKQNDAV